MVGELCTLPPFIGICKFLYEQVDGPFSPRSFYTVKYIISIFKPFGSFSSELTFFQSKQMMQQKINFH